MATDTELAEAALAFVEQSDNNKREYLSPTIFGERGRGYKFEYDQHLRRTVVSEWDPFVDDKGVFHEACWSGDYIEEFIGGIALLASKNTNEEEIGKVVALIKLYLPEIEGSEI